MYYHYTLLALTIYQIAAGQSYLKYNHITLEARQSVKLHHNVSSCQVAFAAVITCMSEQCKPGAPSHMTVPKHEASCNDVMSCG